MKVEKGKTTSSIQIVLLLKRKMKEFIVEFVKLNLTHLVGSQKIYESNQYENNSIPSNKITYESTLKKNRQ